MTFKVQNVYFVSLFFSRADDDIEAGLTGAVVQTTVIIVRVAVSRRTRCVNQIHVFCVDDRSSSAVKRGNRWCRAAHVHSYNLFKLHHQFSLIEYIFDYDLTRVNQLV